MVLPAQLAFLDVGGQEMFVILVVALLIFGGRLPEVARNFGKTVGEFRRSAQKLTRDFRYDANDSWTPRFPHQDAIKKWTGMPREPEPPDSLDGFGATDPLATPQDSTDERPADEFSGGGPVEIPDSEDPPLVNDVEAAGDPARDESDPGPGDQEPSKS